MQDRQAQIQEIIDFVRRHKNSYASQTVCSRVLGEDFMGINDDTINELRARLPEVDSEELEACYYIIK